MNVGRAIRQRQRDDLVRVLVPAAAIRRPVGIRRAVSQPDRDMPVRLLARPAGSLQSAIQNEVVLDRAAAEPGSPTKQPWTCPAPIGVLGPAPSATDQPERQQGTQHSQIARAA